MTPSLYKINSRSLRDRDWKIGYGSDEDNLIVDFYIPALEWVLCL